MATYADCNRNICALVAEYGRQGILTGDMPIRFVAAKGISPNEGGVVTAMTPRLRFKDGATLSVLEVVHVILDPPHFNAPLVTLEIILMLLAVNVYSQAIYSKQIVGQQIHLAV